MSYREILLTSVFALEPDERRDLEDWLRVLKEDCGTFGATPEDEDRMARIRRRLAETHPVSQ